MPTKIDDSQLNSAKLEKLVTSVGYIRAPIEDENEFPNNAQDGERVYVKSLKKEFVFDAGSNEWILFGTATSSQIEEKSMVFVIQKPVAGIQKVEMMFPYKGIVTEISANAISAGTANTSFQIEKCSQDNYDDGLGWTNILNDEIIIQANKKSLIMPIENEVTVDKNDYFRVNINNVGSGIEGLTLNIKIKLTI